MKTVIIASFINLTLLGKDTIFRSIKLVPLIIPPLLLLYITCANPVEPDQNVKFHFILTEGFNQSKTTLRLNNTILMDSTVSSILLAPNTGSSHWFASEGESVFQKGDYNLQVKIENIIKDTLITLNDSLLVYIAFSGDSSKIGLTILKRSRIYM
jgi:hypothetical protein